MAELGGTGRREVGGHGNRRGWRGVEEGVGEGKVELPLLIAAQKGGSGWPTAKILISGISSVGVALFLLRFDHPGEGSRAVVVSRLCSIRAVRTRWRFIERLALIDLESSRPFEEFLTHDIAEWGAGGLVLRRFNDGMGDEQRCNNYSAARRAWS